MDKNRSRYAYTSKRGGPGNLDTVDYRYLHTLGDQERSASHMFLVHLVDLKIWLLIVTYLLLQRLCNGRMVNHIERTPEESTSIFLQ